MPTMIPHEDFDPRLRQNGDEVLLVKFEVRPMLDKSATEEQGRPIYRDREYVSIRAPGSPDEVCRPATRRDIDRFPRHYQAFKNRVGNEEHHEGTLLVEWPMVTRSQAEELAFFGVKTVEQLAAMSDANGQQLMGFHGLKRKANEWLDTAAKGINAAELKAELDKRDKVIAELTEQLSAMQEAQKEQPKPRGRKPKVATEQEE